MHKRIVEPVLARLDEDRATYYSEIAHRLEDDPRTGPLANVVFTVLAETAGDVPPNLPMKTFVNLILDFARRRQRAILALMYSRAYIDDPHVVRPATLGFVSEAVAEIMRLGAAGEIDTGETEVYTFGPGDDPDAFPYADWGDDEE